MRWIYLFLLSFIPVSYLNAQDNRCDDFVVAIDPAMPVYTPLSLATHIEGTVHFVITLSPELQAEVKLLDGPHFLVGAAQDYFEHRRYSWKTVSQHAACSYIAQIEYRIVAPQSDDVNNFYRVTILGMGHTLVEAQLVKPTCQDCRDFRCPLDSVTESKPLTYPAVARAAHVEGDVSALLKFDAKGQLAEAADWTGPEMLRKPTLDYLRSWRLTSMPTYMDSCQATILIEYKLTTATEQPSEVHVYKADPSHILVEDHPALLVDPVAEITKRKKFLGLF